MSHEEVGAVLNDKHGTAEAESRLIAAPHDPNNDRDDALALAFCLTIVKESRELQG
jgi:Holliday junction resolvasome RuvABC endonuclease subunit